MAWWVSCPRLSNLEATTATATARTTTQEEKLLPLPHLSVICSSSSSINNMGAKRAYCAQQQQPQQQKLQQQHQQQQQQQQPPIPRFPMEHVSVGGISDICPSSSNYKRCMLASQSHQSQSITALPTVSDNFGSYTTLPLDHHHSQQQQQQQPQQHLHHHMSHTPICTRHCSAAAAIATPTNAQRWCAASAAAAAAPLPMPTHTCCYMYNAAAAGPAQLPVPPPPAQFGGQQQYCICDNWYQRHHSQQQQQHAEAKANGCYFGYDHHVAAVPGGGGQLTDEEDSAFPALPDREFHLLHRNIPALRRTGVDTARIRQYFYPDGGWGWIICGISFLVHILTSGLQLSYGLLLFYAVQHLHNSSGIELLGALSWSISMLVTPFVVALCRKRSIRLLSIVGGLVLPLGMLFTSFATEFGQVVFSYGIVFGIGVSMVREASTVMLGNYFKRRRQFVEMVAMTGEGVGIALFSVILKEGVGKAGWRLGLQIVAALTSLSFFMGIMYRPASLYHPQRRAIQHLKNQRKKLREKKPIPSLDEEPASKYCFLDVSSLKSVTVKILLMTSGVASFGIYTPMFLMALNAAKEGSDVQELVLLQTFLGISTAMGVVVAGALLRRPFTIRHFLINTKIVSQLFIAIVALSILFLSFVMGYKGLCILSWCYGIGLGGFQYSLKILALERVKLKHFSKAWSYIRGVESIPVLISVPLTSFLNDYSLKYGRAGYYICAAAAAISGIIIFFINEPHGATTGQAQRNQTNGLLPPPSLIRHAPSSMRQHRTPHMRSVGFPMDYTAPSTGCDYMVAPDLLNRSCISLNQIEYDPHAQQHRQHASHYNRLSNCGVRQQQHVHYADESADPMPQYSFGQGSIGARMGKRLQKSLSFIQQQNCCDGQIYCSWHGSYQLGCKDGRSSDTQPLICTCSPPSSYAQSSRSRSVPEGLSTMSQHCSCRGTGYAAPPPMRDFIYVPHHSAGHTSSLPRTPRHKLAQHHMPCCTQHESQRATPQYRLKRSQSLCRPVHFVEQITTSV